MRIVCVEISNFRGIKELVWSPSPKTNCLIGGGDSCKTTILDAIELVFAARNTVTFDDADFFEVDPKANPISITVTLGDLPVEYISESRYGLYTRGWDAASSKYDDEPDEERSGLETVLSIRLTVDNTLEPDWTIFNARVERGELQRRPLAYADRLQAMPTRLGPYADRHLGWGRQSILNRLTGGTAGSRGLLAEAGRVAREEFSKDAEQLFSETIDLAKKAALQLGVPISDNLQALLDVQAVGLSAGGISLHDDGLPLRRLGLGSSRLFVAALQDQASSNASIALIDEIEHGLEPHRISRILKHLKSPTSRPTLQTFITTHSPVVLIELKVDELNVVRRDAKTGKLTIVAASKPFKSLDTQAQPRTIPETYLSPHIIVCEGKTEVGILRGLDDYWITEKKPAFASLGVVAVTGRGVDNAPCVAGYFQSLGYRVGLLLDSDRQPKDGKILEELETSGVAIFRWAKNMATEDHLFQELPSASVVSLIKAAAKQVADQTIVDLVNNKLLTKRMANLEELINASHELEVRAALGEAAKGRQKPDTERGWFKDIALGEWIGRKHLGPNLKTMSGHFPDTIEKIRMWAHRDA